MFETVKRKCILYMWSFLKSGQCGKELCIESEREDELSDPISPNQPLWMG